jgi:hypothetical protein
VSCSCCTTCTSRELLKVCICKCRTCISPITCFSKCYTSIWSICYFVCSLVSCFSGVRRMKCKIKCCTSSPWRVYTL